MDLLQVALAFLIFMTSLTDNYGSQQSGVKKAEYILANRKFQDHLGNRIERDADDSAKSDDNVKQDGVHFVEDTRDPQNPGKMKEDTSDHQHPGKMKEDTSDPQHPGKVKASDVPPRTIIITLQSDLDPGFDQSLHDAFQNQGSPPNTGSLNVFMHKKAVDDDGESLATADKDRTENRTGPQLPRQQVPMTVKPSMQLIGIVVGIVLVSVFVTGFIRWRVKKHLEAKRLQKLVTGKNSILKKKVRAQILDTIYECDEATDGNHLQQGSKTRGKSASSQSHSPQLSTTRRPDLRTSFSEDSYHMSRYRYRPRRSEFNEGWEHDISITRPAHRYEALSRSPSVGSEARVDMGDPVTEPLLRPQELASTGQTQSLSRLMTPPGVPTVRRSPSPGRSAMSSILNSWFSISFNRDWVGRRWLERHNLRINEVLSNNSNQLMEEGQHQPTTVSVVGNGVDDMCDVNDSVTSEIETFHDMIETNFTNSTSSLRQDALGPTWSHDHLDENANVTSAPYTPDNASALSNSTLVNCMNLPYTSLDNTSPPTYSLLTNTGSPRSSYTPRQGNRNRNCRQQRLAVSDSVSLNPDYNMNYHVSGSRQPTSAFSIAMLGQLQTTSISPASNGVDREQQNSNSQYGVSYHDGYPDITNSFAHQSGVVIEQLSDGSQIIFLPAPSLPSYHNDNPPPYQK